PRSRLTEELRRARHRSLRHPAGRRGSPRGRRGARLVRPPRLQRGGSSRHRLSRVARPSARRVAVEWPRMAAEADHGELVALRRRLGCLEGEESWPTLPKLRPPQPKPVPDMADVRGQEVGRAAVELAAAGGHHLLLTGPPGAGKTMLARRLPGLLPPLEREEA